MTELCEVVITAPDQRRSPCSRPQYRYHEPPDYWAADLDFRLAADVLSEGVSAYPNVPNTVSASKRCSENESKENDE